MTARARLIFAPAVRHELPPQVIEQARSTLNAYTCIGCGRPGDAREELTSVIVVKPPNFPPLIRCAHATCVQSHVTEGPAVDPKTIGDEAVTYQKVVFRWNRGGRYVIEPMLLVDRPRNVVGISPGGDPTGLVTQLLLEDGFELAMALDQPFPNVPGYTVRLRSDGSGRIDQLPGRPGPFLEYFDDDDPAELWHATTRETGWLTVVTGLLGIDGAAAEQVGPLLQSAISSGGVLGGRIRVVAHTSAASG